MKTAHKGQDSQWEYGLQKAASAFPYPQTPPLHTAVQAQLHAARSHPSPLPTNPHPHPRRGLALAALLALLALAAMLSVPAVRAALGRILQIGAVTIFVGETAGELEHPPTAAPATSPAPTPEGTMTLEQARAAALFPIWLPDATVNLGAPDTIDLQQHADAGMQIIILTWFDPPQIETGRLVLYQINVVEYAYKMLPRDSLVETTVHTRPAFWITGEHLLQIPDFSGNMQERLVGDVLIWTDGELTFRLEGAPTLEDAVRIAESLDAGDLE